MTESAIELPEALVAEYVSMLSGKSVPKSDAEKEALKELSERRKKWLVAKAAELGYENFGTLQKDLEKANKKTVKAAAPPKTPQEPKAPKEAAAHKGSEEKSEPAQDLDEQMRRVLGKPSDNVGRGDFFVNPPERLAKHLAETGGKYRTRFPPEPNGWLHIGHAKSMSVNFGIARANGGDCVLRFDDTNPEAEKQEYIDGILDNVAWLGHKPFLVTYTSDYFEVMYDLAKELIRRGKAYVCFMTNDQVKAQRDALISYNKECAKAAEGEVVPFPYDAVFDKARETHTVEENLRYFEHMRQGRYEEGEATLRMKGDFKSKNPNMWDHMAYRIMYKAHPHRGDKWCIYPTYDYSHCLIDSLENITHSICTLEFESRQATDSSYHWLLDALDMYHAKTWEMSRCSISHNVMSKRRLHRLVMEGKVEGWDDPRLLTLAGLRRRGYTPAAINDFCRRIGVARSSNDVTVSTNVLECCIREELDHSAERRMAIIDPVRVVIVNYDHPELKKVVTVPNHPGKGREDMGTRDLPLTKTIYIPRDKFRTEMIPGYKGMVPGVEKNKAIRLLYAALVEYESHDTDASGNVTEIRVNFINVNPPPKGCNVVSWVPSTAVTMQARIYDRLFKNCVDAEGKDVHAELAAKNLGVDYLDLFNENSLVIKDILVEPCVLAELDLSRHWQFITVGYFCLDSKFSTNDRPVLNLTCSLKEDSGKPST